MAWIWHVVSAVHKFNIGTHISLSLFLDLTKVDILSLTNLSLSHSLSLHLSHNFLLSRPFVIIFYLLSNFLFENIPSRYTSLSISSYFISLSLSECFWKRAIPGLFFVCFRIFKQTLQFLQQINVKKCPSSIQRSDSNPGPSGHESSHYH